MYLAVFLIEVLSSVQTTTNIINIYNSKVIINNTVIPAKDTNTVQVTKKMVIIPRNILKDYNGKAC
jgi:hypothetical protein